MTKGMTFGLCAMLASGLSAGTARAGDLSGAVLSAPCFTCHGPGGASPGAIPSLTDLDAAKMSAQLAKFRGGDAEATIMSRIAKGYTEAELAAVVDYLTTHR